MAKNSDYVKNYDKMSAHKTAMDQSAPGAIDAADQPEGRPSMGTTAPAGKSTEPGPHKYRFSTTTPVTTAKEVPGAHAKAVRLQEGENMSKMTNTTPPEGDKEEEGEN